jgi:hypothetical protein
MFNKVNQNIIQILGIDKLPVEKQKDAMESLGGIVYQEVMLRALDEMSEADKDEFEKLIETNPDPETMFAHLASKVPNLEKIVEEEAQSLHEESADILGSIGK